MFRGGRNLSTDTCDNIPRSLKIFIVLFAILTSVILYFLSDFPKYILISIGVIAAISLIACGFLLTRVDRKQKKLRTQKKKASGQLLTEVPEQAATRTHSLVTIEVPDHAFLPKTALTDHSQTSSLLDHAKNVCLAESKYSQKTSSSHKITLATNEDDVIDNVYKDCPR